MSHYHLLISDKTFCVRHESHEKRPTTFELARACLWLGAQGFGGLGAVLALLTRDLVERRGWLRESDVTEALTYTKLLPGPAIVQVAAYLGWKLRGWPGALAAAAAFLLPAFAMMLGLAAGYRFLAPLAGVPAAIGGLTTVVTALLLVTTAKLGRAQWTPDRSGIVAVVLALAVCVASVFYGVNPALLVVAAGLLGVLREAMGKRKVDEA